jgi:hypothetical protein
LSLSSPRSAFNKFTQLLPCGGGGNRIAGILLAVATAVLLVIGTGPVADIRELIYAPINYVCLIFRVAVMLVGALIFVLGIDLVKEALWDTRHRREDGMQTVFECSENFHSSSRLT